MLDQSCVDQVLPVDFAGDSSLSEAVLGTADFWERKTPPPGCHSATPP